MVVAFAGWTDAGDAATMAVRRLIEACELEPFDSIEPDDYVDFAVHRPLLRMLPDGSRGLSWPASLVFAPTRPSERTPLAGDADMEVSTGKEGDIFALVGAEPSRRWAQFTEEFIEIVQGCEIDAIVFVGAMLADVPHTRPIATMITSSSDELKERLGVSQSEYEGPVGIATALAMAAQGVGIPSAALWASLPHYVHHGPSPKGVIALIDRLSEILDVTVPLGDLPDDSGEWERGINELTENDHDLRAYIGKLEEQRDAVESPEASGEAIANDFERFLRDQARRPDPRFRPEGTGSRSRSDTGSASAPESPGATPETDDELDDPPPV